MNCIVATTEKNTFHREKAVREMNKKAKYVFLAHWIENWNWMIPHNRDLNLHPDHAWQWAWLSPLFWIISTYYMLGRKDNLMLDHFTFNGSVEGRLIVLRNFGWHFFLKGQRSRIRARILRTVLAEQDSADVIGLGALTKAEWLTAGGKWIVDELGDRLHVPVVHGDTLTAAAVIRRCLNLIEKYRIKSVFITGATSKIGRACVLDLASRGIRVKLYTGSQERFEEIRAEAGGNGKYLSRAASLEEGHDCTLWVTGKAVPAGNELIRHIPAGAVVVNFSVPNPVGGALSGKRPDLLFVEGGLLSFDPALSTQTFNVRLYPGETYACHAGTMVHAYKGWKHHEVGPVEMDKLWEAWEAAVELGFYLKPLSGEGKRFE